MFQWGEIQFLYEHFLILDQVYLMKILLVSAFKHVTQIKCQHNQYYWSSNGFGLSPPPLFFYILMMAIFIPYEQIYEQRLILKILEVMHTSVYFPISEFFQS